MAIKISIEIDYAKSGTMEDIKRLYELYSIPDWLNFDAIGFNSYNRMTSQVEVTKFCVENVKQDFELANLWRIL